MAYEQVGFPEAMKRGLEPPYGTWEYSKSWDYEWDYRVGIWCVDGVYSIFIGCDGGEPEDQTLDRDWSWVVEALNDAYEQGRASYIY